MDSNLIASTFEHNFSVRSAGGIYRVKNSDIASILGNPGNLFFMHSKTFEFSYQDSIEDTYWNFTGYAFPYNRCVFALSGGFYNGGEIEVNTTDEQGLLISSKKIKAEKNSIITLSCGFPLKDYVYAGANLKYLQSKLIQEYTAEAVSTDLALSFRSLNDRFILSLIGKNLNKPGLRYIEYKDRILPSFMFSLLLNISPNFDFLINTRGICVEYNFGNNFSLRGGCRKEEIDFGLDFFVKNIEFAYGIKQNSNFSFFHQLSIALKFRSLDKYSTGRRYYYKGLYKKAIAAWSNIRQNEKELSQSRKMIKLARRKMKM